MSEPARLQASAIATVPAGTFGPYLCMRKRGGLVVWAEPELSGAKSFWARQVGPAGDTKLEAVRVDDAPDEIGLVSLRSIGTDFVLLATHKTREGESVVVRFLSEAAKMRGGPLAVGRAVSLLWIEAVPSPRGVWVLWASRSDRRAQIFAAEVSANGELLRPAQLLASDAGAWQAAALGAELVLGVTLVGKEARRHGPIELIFADETGAPRAPVVVSAEPTADLDLDLVVLENRAILAWSDHRSIATRVYAAAVDAQGKLLVPPTPAANAFGEQALLRVVQPAEGQRRAYLAWEDLSAPATSHRTFQLAELTPEARVNEPRAELEYWKMDGTVPELAATQLGVAALTLAPECLRAEPCANDASIVPEFVALDATMAPRAAEPLRLERESQRSLAWGLACGEHCVALSATSAVPTPVALARLEHRSDAFRSPAARFVLPPPPRVVASDLLAEGDPLSQVAVTKTAGAELVGTITDFDPTTPWVRLKKAAPDGRFEPLRARIELHAFADRPPFTALAPAEPLSLRAHSLGGLALADAAVGQEDVLAAWAGIDNGQPQVFVTLVDKLGKKKSQRMLTHKRGDLGEIAALRAGDDLFVAWVDERSGDPEVYASKLDRTLRSLSPEQRITNAPGAATDLSLIQTAKGVLAVWADSREADQPGWADIYTAQLGADAARAGAETCLERTRPHSFGAAPRAFADGALVAWFEAASETEGARLELALLDASGHVREPISHVPLEGAPLALGLDCGDTACHVAAVLDVSSRAELWAVSFAQGKASAPAHLLTLGGAPTGVAPVVRDQRVYVAETREGHGYLRRLLVDW
ncbi:MAG TPA: hypothetical protein VGI10_13280 [Polyangiaceae bacterium]